MKAIDFLLASRQDMFQLLKKKLERAQEHKKVVDAHRKDVWFLLLVIGFT